MTLLIIGSSGMLLGATTWLIENNNEEIILCSRDSVKYGDLITKDNVHFQYFDFQKEESYDNLNTLIKNKSISTLLIWIHSPYYEMLNMLIRDLDCKTIFLVQGSSSKDYRFNKSINIIKLGKHPVEDRWLTHEEISQKVIESMMYSVHRVDCQ